MKNIMKTFSLAVILATSSFGSTNGGTIPNWSPSEFFTQKDDDNERQLYINLGYRVMMDLYEDFRTRGKVGDKKQKDLSNCLTYMHDVLVADSVIHKMNNLFFYLQHALHAGNSLQHVDTKEFLRSKQRQQMEAKAYIYQAQAKIQELSPKVSEVIENYVLNMEDSKLVQDISKADAVRKDVRNLLQSSRFATGE